MLFVVLEAIPVPLPGLVCYCLLLGMPLPIPSGILLLCAVFPAR